MESRREPRGSGSVVGQGDGGLDSGRGGSGEKWADWGCPGSEALERSRADRGSSEREELLGRQHGRRLPSRCPQSRPCGGQWGQDSNSDSWKSELQRPALFVLRGVGPQPCAPRLAFPFLTSFSGSLNCCRGGQGNQVGSCSGISHRPGSTGTMPFVLSLGTPGSSGQQLWPAVIPGHRGFLSSACPHEPCDRELATCPQAPLTLAGSWASAPHSPVRERAGMPRAGSGLETSVPAPSSGQRSPPASLAGATVRKTPFSLWALSGQALGLRGQVGGVSHILHLRCHYSQQSLMWSQSSTEIMCPGVPQRCFSCYCVTNAPSGTRKQNGPRGSHEGDSGGRATAGPPRTTTPLSRPQRPLL